MSDAPDRDMPAEIKKFFSLHGHGFQYKTIHHAETLFKASESRWMFEVAEYPVELNGAQTHIDAVFQQQVGAVKTFLVGECKRVNPARGCWVFMKAPYTRSGANKFEVAFDELHRGGGRAVHLSNPPTGHGIFHVSREMKSPQVGDATGLKLQEGAIDEAVTQVLRGSGGLQPIVKRSGDWDSADIVRFLPVVFTTAELWKSETNLADADQVTGLLPLAKAEKVPWLWYVYNRSPSLVPSAMADPFGGGLSEDLRIRGSRAVAIVNPDGIREFLSAMLINLMGG